MRAGGGWWPVLAVSLQRRSAADGCQLTRADWQRAAGLCAGAATDHEQRPAMHVRRAPRCLDGRLCDSPTRLPMSQSTAVSTRTWSHVAPVNSPQSLVLRPHALNVLRITGLHVVENFTIIMMDCT
jgi:hypothetical protein